MWLINVHSYALEEFLGEGETPPYAILSHTWSRPASAEVTFREMRGDLAFAQSKPCFMKIYNSCVIAKSHDLSWVWVDTCCIDKTSSADLSEAINSMYRYYRDSAECLVYLADVSYHQPGASRAKKLEAIGQSRWFSRGWTLQELIAPQERHFFDVNWDEIPWGADLLRTLSRAGNVAVDVLEHRHNLPNISVAERMTMASKRSTTRGEDMAYCLFGIFDVNLPILYGEGAKKAFRRLQLEIMAASPLDQSIFAWRGADRSNSGLLANSPSDFASTPSIYFPRYGRLVPFSMTNMGLSITCTLVDVPEEKDITPSRPNKKIRRVLAPLQCHPGANESSSFCLYLESMAELRFHINDKWLPAYRRVRCSEWKLVPRETIAHAKSETIIISEDKQLEALLSRLSMSSQLPTRIGNTREIVETT
ncbi:unnamed protein product [Clonostachys rosea]|uniref:Heterokaryon incompatibility domain-containing protein n=1 Tax=Bionectria ochroleuca TaxID=29856 RepID=A0ABY6U544_BIOOC|nr:unnamed protein product [Clonostachys rosea]